MYKYKWQRQNLFLAEYKRWMKGEKKNTVTNSATNATYFTSKCVDKY